MILNDTLNIADQRVHVRHACEAIIRWSYFNTKQYFSAKILNFSRDGIYIETANEIRPGSTICTHLEKIISLAPDLLNHECPRLVSLAQVMWCRASSGPDRIYFGAGLKYPFLF